MEITASNNVISINDLLAYLESEKPYAHWLNGEDTLKKIIGKIESLNKNKEQNVLL